MAWKVSKWKVDRVSGETNRQYLIRVIDAFAIAMEEASGTAISTYSVQEEWGTETATNQASRTIQFFNDSTYEYIRFWFNINSSGGRVDVVLTTTDTASGDYTERKMHKDNVMIFANTLYGLPVKVHGLGTTTCGVSNNPIGPDLGYSLGLKCPILTTSSQNSTYETYMAIDYSGDDFDGRQSETAARGMIVSDGKCFIVITPFAQDLGARALNVLMYAPDFYVTQSDDSYTQGGITKYSPSTETFAINAYFDNNWSNYAVALNSRVLPVFTTANGAFNVGGVPLFRNTSNWLKNGVPDVMSYSAFDVISAPTSAQTTTLIKDGRPYKGHINTDYLRMVPIDYATSFETYDNGNWIHIGTGMLIPWSPDAPLITDLFI